MSSPPKFDISTPIDAIHAAYPGQLNGRVLLVTGATAGLGLAFAKFVATHGAGTVIITGRTEEKLAQALSDIQSSVSSSASDSKPNVKTLLMDLTDYPSIRRAVTEVATLGTKIDILLNNAGIMAVPYKKVNGYENQFVANHLGHFLFTNLLISAGTIAQGARIVNATSYGHIYSPVRFDDINFQDGKVYNKWEGYGQSKSANILFSKGLTTRYREMRGIESFSVHPGAILETNLGTHLDPVAEGFKNPDGTWKLQLSLLTKDQGIATYLFAALAPELAGQGGAYLTESQVQETHRPLTDEDAQKLWDLSNRILETEF